MAASQTPWRRDQLCLGRLRRTLTNTADTTSYRLSVPSTSVAGTEKQRTSEAPHLFLLAQAERSVHPATSASSDAADGVSEAPILWLFQQTACCSSSQSCVAGRGWDTPALAGLAAQTRTRGAQDETDQAQNETDQGLSKSGAALTVLLQEAESIFITTLTHLCQDL